MLLRLRRHDGPQEPLAPRPRPYSHAGDPSSPLPRPGHGADHARAGGEEVRREGRLMTTPGKAKARRRRRGEGTLWPTKDDKGRVVGWCAVLNLGWGEDGKRHRRWFRGKTQREVLDALDAAKNPA